MAWCTTRRRALDGIRVGPQAPHGEAVPGVRERRERHRQVQSPGQDRVADDVVEREKLVIQVAQDLIRPRVCRL